MISDLRPLSSYTTKKKKKKKVHLLISGSNETISVEQSELCSNT